MSAHGVALRLNNVRRAFDHNVVIAGMNLEVAAGEFLAMLQGYDRFLDHVRGASRFAFSTPADLLPRIKAGLSR